MGNISHKSHNMGLHEEQLTGRTQQRFFSAEEGENYTYPWAHDVDTDKSAEFDADDMTPTAINLKIRELLIDGHGTITVHNPKARHGIGVGILNRVNLNFVGSLGYFGCGLIDGPNVRISGRVGWSCAENMMAGTVIIEKNAGSTFGAAIRGGDLVCKGSVGSRTGIDQKGGTIIVGGDTGAFSGFMMQRGRMVICGNAGKNLGDSMYDGTIYVGGKIAQHFTAALGGRGAGNLNDPFACGPVVRGRHFPPTPLLRTPPYSKHGGHRGWRARSKTGTNQPCA